MLDMGADILTPPFRAEGTPAWNPSRAYPGGHPHLERWG